MMKNWFSKDAALALFRLALVYGVFFGYSLMWRAAIVSPSTNWRDFVGVASFFSGLVALAVVMSAPARPVATFSRLLSRLPDAVGAIGIVCLLFKFPSPFLREWFTGFLVASPVLVAYLIIHSVIESAPARGPSVPSNTNLG